MSEASDDVRFASAVGAFGMKLRESDFIEELSYNDIINIAKQVRGKDQEGYRADCIRLMQIASGLPRDY